MRTRRSVLARFISLPREPLALRDLLDDVGLEVKRLDELPGDLGITLELLANRGDHHGLNGLAREIRGRTGGRLTLPPITPLPVDESPVPLRLLTDDCLIYTATLLVRDAPGLGQLGEDSLAPIVAADQNPVSAPVDATNLANLELGQPTHAFDADTIVGGITIRHSLPGETCLPLFADAPVELPEGTVVIADDDKILAVAGVIGCQESRTTETTRRILLESACFDPVKVRKAARALNLSTDSSARFERGSDPTAPLVGAGRVVHLLTTEAGWTVQGTTGQIGSWRDPRRVIPLSVPAAAAFLEYPLSDEDVRERLGRYGFDVSPTWPDWDADEGWQMPASLEEYSRDRLRNMVLVAVPPHRLWDVEDRADLYEELARSIGYNNTPEHLPSIDMGALPSPAEQRKSLATQILLGHGFYEVVVDGFHTRDLAERLALPAGHPLTRHVETQNALDRAYSLLKNSPLPQALEGVALNLNNRVEQIKAFEWTRTFHPDKTADNGVCRERDVLWAIAVGPARHPSWRGRPHDADGWTLKGIVENLACDLQLDLTVEAADPAVASAALLHPGRQATIYLGERAVGVLGEVHPAIVANFRIKRARPVYLELDASALTASVPAPRTWHMPSAHQAIDRSLAFTLPLRVQAGDVARTMEHSGPEWLEHVDMVDLFAHEDDGKAVSTVTFALRFATEEQARTADEVNAVCDHLIQAVLGTWGGRGVKLRA